LVLLFDGSGADSDYAGVMAFSEQLHGCSQ